MHIHAELGLYCWVYYNSPDWVHVGSYIKLRTVSILVQSHVMVRLYRTQFPESRCLFMYRDIISVAKSLYRVSMVEPSMRLTYILGKLSGQLTKMVIDSMGFDGSVFSVRLEDGLTLGVLLSAVTTKSYLDMRRHGFDISALRYEDLVARPLDMCRLILEFCHLPVSLAELAVKALDVDSQRNSIMAKSIIGRFKEPQLTPRNKVKLNELLKKLEVPLIGEPGIIEGTLTCS